MNYREKVEKKYGIKLNKKYEVHHIDLDRENNEIENLLILPAFLHNKYHTCLNEINRCKKETNVNFDAKIYGNVLNKNSVQINCVKDMIEVLEECSIWYDYKMYLEGLLPNIHKIKLEE